MGYLKQRIHVYKKLSGDEWSSPSTVWDGTGEVLTNAQASSVNLGLGKKKDTFSVELLNVNNEYFVTKFSGDASTTQFSLTHYPIPTAVQNVDDKFSVWVDDVKQNSGDFTIDNGAGTITFNTAPASGTRNIEVRFNVLDHGDTIRIWQWRDVEWSTLTDAEKQTAMIMDGVVNNVKSNRQDTGRTIVVSGKNWIEMLLDTLAPISATDSTVDAIIGTNVVPSGVLKTVAHYNPAREIFWDPDNLSTKSDGVTAFPTVDYAADYKTALEIIEELSTDEYTGDGTYMWYVWVATYNDGTHTAGNRYFRWQAKTTAQDKTLTEGTDDFQKINITKKVDKVINACIYDLGKDAYGHRKHDLLFDPVSMGRNGAKWKYITKTKHWLRWLLNFEKDNGAAAAWPSGTSTTANFPASYPYTFAYPSVPSGSVNPVTTDAEFNDTLVDIGKTEARYIIQAIIDQFKNAMHEVGLNMPPQDAGTFTLGEVALMTFPSYNLEAKKLRLMDITYTPWNVQLKYAEDEKLLAE